MRKQKFYDSTDERWDKLGQSAAIALALVLPLSTALTSICIGLVLLTWILGPHRDRKQAIFFRHPLVVWLYPLFFISLLGATYSIADNKVMYRNICDTLRLGLIPVLIYFYQPKEIAQKALWAFAGAMVFTLLFAFLKVYGGLPIGLKYTTGAVFKSHIKTSFFMAIAAFFLAFQVPRVRLSYRCVLIPIVLLMVYYLFFMSVGRIGYITLITCLLILAWHWAGLKGFLISILVSMGLLMGAYYASPVFHARISLLTQDLDFYHQGGRLLESSLGSRITFADTSYDLILQKPVLGWGLGSYGDAYAQSHAGEKTLLTDNPHNEYLRIGVELGLLGLLSLLMLFYQQLRLARDLPSSIRGFCQGVLLTFMLGCFLNSWLRDSAEGYFYCLMTAILYASCPLPQKERLVKATVH